MINPILRKAIAVYGVENQTIKAIEEMSELTKELSKALLGKADNDHIREEIADSEIMLEQLRSIYDTDNGNRIDFFKQAKIKRLDERVKETLKNHDKELVRLDEDEAI